MQLSIYKMAGVTLTILLSGSGCTSPNIKLPKVPDYASMSMRGSESELQANKPPLASQANDVRVDDTSDEALMNKHKPEDEALLTKRKSEYYDYIFSKTIDDPKFKSDIMACASAIQHRDATVFKKGFTAEIKAATSKQQAEDMKAILPRVDDPLLYRTWCMKELVLLMFDTNLSAPGNSLDQELLPRVKHVHEGYDRYRLEWTYPTADLKAYREDLTNLSIEVIRKEFKKRIAARNTKEKEEVQYFFAKQRIAQILEQCLDDFDYVNLEGRANDFRSWLARGIERTIYLRLANSKKYSADIVKPVRR